MNFFEQELRKLTDAAGGLDGERYSGRACFGRLSENLRVRLEFVTLGHHDHYEAIKATIINRNDGPVDSLTLRFSDILGRKLVSNPNFKDGVKPHIWVYNGKPEWSVYTATPADYEKLADALNDYLDVFRDIDQGMDQGGFEQSM